VRQGSVVSGPGQFGPIVTTPESRPYTVCTFCGLVGLSLPWQAANRKRKTMARHTTIASL
jgi:hypothetical protein